LVYLFPGQGSQRRGMGRELFDKFPQQIESADWILGWSLRDLCLEDRDQRLRQTQFTQPALYVVSALTYLQAVEERGKEPDAAVGHSIGEYAALFAAGALDFESGLRLVKRRGELMAQARAGSMAAIVGLPSERVADLLGEHLPELDLANLNSPTQVVISGSESDIEAGAAVFEGVGARYIRLNVSGAFHSRYMAQAAEEMRAALSLVEFKPLKFPIVSNVEGEPYSTERMAELLGRQLTEPVQWVESIRYLLRDGHDEFQELGPGQVLSKLVRAIQAEPVPPVVLPKPPHVASKNGTVTTPKAEHSGLTPERLGNPLFLKEYGVRCAYVSGAMYKGIASAELVTAMGRAGLLSFLGTGGLTLPRVEEALRTIKAGLGPEQPYGMNLLSDLEHPEREEETVDLYLKHGVRVVEAAAYLRVTPSLVRYRLCGARLTDEGAVAPNQVIAKISRPEIAEVFLSPAPGAIVRSLLDAGRITAQEAAAAPHLSVASDLCVEADSGGHTDMGVASALVPTILGLRDQIMARHRYARPIMVGAAGGIGTPAAAASAFVLGADFILTGSVNQCTVEAGTSDLVKDMLARMNVQDTAYAPAGDMFEIGAKIQVLSKGLFFPARANRLYDLYRHHRSLDELDARTREQIQDKYFGRSFEEVWEETRAHYLQSDPEQVERAERNPKHKMALIFRWYFVHSMRLAMAGGQTQLRDYQVHCGPALGSFNQWVKGTPLEDWRNRRVADVGLKIMDGTARLLNGWAHS
jgi:trans-AT polyketide synthase/acyltransferase/oxidoreductase domain-containing protein